MSLCSETAEEFISISEKKTLQSEILIMCS